MESAEGQVPLEASAPNNQPSSSRASILLRTSIALGVASLFSLDKGSETHEPQVASSQEMLMQVDSENHATLSQEELSKVLSQIMKNCVSHCDASDASVICGMLSKELSGKTLSDASASVNENLRADFHALAELLNLHPNVASQALAHLKEELANLGYTDARRYALLFLPSESENCPQLQNVDVTASDFLQEERVAGRYQGTLPKYAMMPQRPH